MCKKILFTMLMGLVLAVSGCGGGNTNDTSGETDIDGGTGSDSGTNTDGGNGENPCNSGYSLIYSLDTAHPSASISSSGNKVFVKKSCHKEREIKTLKVETLGTFKNQPDKYNMYYSNTDAPHNGYSRYAYYNGTQFEGLRERNFYASKSYDDLISKIEAGIGQCKRYADNTSGGQLDRNDNFWTYFCPKIELVSTLNLLWPDEKITDSEDDGGSEATSNCVTIAGETVGLKQKLRQSSFGVSKFVIDTEETIKTISSTSMSVDVINTLITGENIDTSVGYLSSTGYTQYFTIQNNYRDVTRIVTHSPAGDSEVNYNPYWRHAINKVCKNQTWTSTYTVSGASQSIIYTIESINEQKSVQAGTFTTVKVKQEDGNTIGTYLYDVATGAWVYGETYNNLSELIGKTELMSINK